MGPQCCQGVLYVPGPFLLHKQGQFTSTLSSNLTILPSPSHSSLRITSWFAGTEAGGLSETSSHPCLHLLCPPTTDKHRCCCINSQAYCALDFISSPPGLGSNHPSHILNHLSSFCYWLIASTKCHYSILKQKQKTWLCFCYQQASHFSAPVTAELLTAAVFGSTPPKLLLLIPSGLHIDKPNFSAGLLDLWASLTQLTPSPWLICVPWLPTDQ